MGRAGSLGISNVGQTVLSRSMESRIWHQLASSVEGGFRKGTMASADLDARHFSFSLCATGVVQAATLVLELRGSESEYRVSPCVSSLRGTAWDSSSFFYQLNPRWFLQLEVMGTYLPGTGILGWGTWRSQDISQIFIYDTWVRDLPLLHLRPSHQSGWMRFL